MGIGGATGDHGDDVTVDHVLPLSKGGTSAIENLSPLCRRRNSAKGGGEWWCYGAPGTRGVGVDASASGMRERWRVASPHCYVEAQREGGVRKLKVKMGAQIPVFPTFFPFDSGGRFPGFSLAGAE